MGEKITLEQGVPQGDVLSPYIFNIAVEFLLLKITNTKTIEGVKFARWDIYIYIFIQFKQHYTMI